MSPFKVIFDVGMGLFALVALIVGLRSGTMPSILGWSDDTASRKSNPAMFWFYAFLLASAVIAAAVIGYLFTTGPRG